MKIIFKSRLSVVWELNLLKNGELFEPIEMLEVMFIFVSYWRSSFKLCKSICLHSVLLKMWTHFDLCTLNFLNTLCTQPKIGSNMNRYNSWVNFLNSKCIPNVRFVHFYPILGWDTYFFRVWDVWFYIVCLYLSTHLHSFSFFHVLHWLTLESYVTFHWFYLSPWIFQVNHPNISRIPKTVGTPKEEFFHLHRDNALWALSGTFSRF